MHRPAFHQQNLIQQKGRVLQNSNPGKLPSNLSNNSLSLPSGWKREEILKPCGLTAGKTEVYYISPNGRKVRSKQEMQTILGDNFDLSNFDWRSGKFSNNQQRLKRPGTLDDVGNSKATKIDQRLSLPTRRTAPITQTGVNLFKNHPESKTSDLKHGPQEPPRQLFWEKRLEGGRACDPETGEPFRSLALPKGIQTSGVPGYHSDQLIQSLVQSLFNRSTPVTGQQYNKAAFEKNACVAINCDQPLTKHYLVTDEDIRQQEARVKELRKKLETAKRKLEPRYESERQG